MKIDWPVVCSFTLSGLLYVLPGQRVDNDPIMMIGCLVFVIAFGVGVDRWMGLGIVAEYVRWLRKR